MSKVWFITGASRGMGPDIATILRHQNYRRLNGRLKIHALLYARIIVSSILNLAAALTACGTFAGSVIVSPDLTR
jgi:NAD(P)-dependent dehydrogenase (short-subunit alcohol dehydrogenase family)